MKQIVSMSLVEHISNDGFDFLFFLVFSVVLVYVMCKLRYLAEL